MNKVMVGEAFRWDKLRDKTIQFRGEIACLGQKAKIKVLALKQIELRELKGGSSTSRNTNQMQRISRGYIIDS